MPPEAAAAPEQAGEYECDRRRLALPTKIRGSRTTRFIPLKHGAGKKRLDGVAERHQLGLPCD